MSFTNYHGKISPCLIKLSIQLISVRENVSFHSFFDVYKTGKSCREFKYCFFQPADTTRQKLVETFSVKARKTIFFWGFAVCGIKFMSKMVNGLMFQFRCFANIQTISNPKPKLKNKLRCYLDTYIDISREPFVNYGSQRCEYWNMIDWLVL